jgi:hypothetical protein
MLWRDHNFDHRENSIICCGNRYVQVMLAKWRTPLRAAARSINLGLVCLDPSKLPNNTKLGYNLPRSV